MSNSQATHAKRSRITTSQTFRVFAPKKLYIRAFLGAVPQLLEHDAGPANLRLIPANFPNEYGVAARFIFEVGSPVEFNDGQVS
jgi:hypothetical protein